MAQQIDRLVVSRGPARITFRGAVFWSKEDITVDLTKETVALPSSAFGDLTEVSLGVKATATLRPVGEFEHLDVLWNFFAALPIGSSIFGNADEALIIQPLDPTQNQVRFHAAGVSALPGLTFTAVDTLLEELTFQMIGKNNTPIDDPARLFIFEANTIVLNDLGYDDTKLLVQSYTNRWLSAGTFTLTFGANTTAAIAYNANAAAVAAALNLLASVIAAGGVTATGTLDDGWTVTFDDVGVQGPISGAVTSMPGGTSVREDILTAGAVGAAKISKLRLYPWHSFAAKEGVKVAFDLQVTEDESDAIGHYDTVYRGLTVTASALPQGVPAEAVLAAAAVQGPASVRGRRLSVGAHHFDVFAEGVFFRLYSANLKTAGLIFGSENQRVPELQWSASRTLTGGVLNPLFYIGTNAPA